jgi:hypothetical protein
MTRVKSERCDQLTLSMSSAEVLPIQLMNALPASADQPAKRSKDERAGGKDRQSHSAGVHDFHATFLRNFRSSSAS